MCGPVWAHWGVNGSIGYIVRISLLNRQPETGLATVEGTSTSTSAMRDVSIHTGWFTTKMIPVLNEKHPPWHLYSDKNCKNLSTESTWAPLLLK